MEYTHCHVTTDLVFDQIAKQVQSMNLRKLFFSPVCLSVRLGGNNLHSVLSKYLEFCQTSVWQNSRFCQTEQNFVGPNFLKSLLLNYVRYYF